MTLVGATTAYQNVYVWALISYRPPADDQHPVKGASRQHVVHQALAHLARCTHDKAGARRGNDSPKVGYRVAPWHCGRQIILRHRTLDYYWSIQIAIPITSTGRAMLRVGCKTHNGSLTIIYFWPRCQSC